MLGRGLTQVAKQVLLLNEGYRADIRVIRNLYCASVRISHALHLHKNLLGSAYVRVLDLLEFNWAKGR